MDDVVLNQKGQYKQRNNRRAFKRNKKIKNQKLKLVGVNTAGLASKLRSFDKMLTKVSPSIFFLQETKMRRIGKIKTQNSSKYQIYEVLRKSKGGGGLAIGVLKDLNPVWVSEGSDEIEIMVVEFELSGLKIRLINAYGPQEKEKVSIKSQFWDRLDSEITQAESVGCAVILQMDGNLRAGSEIIPDDPNPQNYNGKFLANFLENHPNMSVVNSLPVCEGTITRRRQTKNGLEESNLDFFLVCDRIRPFVIKMKIDENQEYPLTNYNSMNDKKKAIDSDHFTLLLELSLLFNKSRPQREELFNFRNKECQNTFKEITTNSNKLSEVFENELPLQEQAKKWEKTLNSFFHKSFTKIRITDRPKEDRISLLIEKRNSLKKEVNKLNKEGKDDENIENEHRETEKIIADESAESNRKLVMENFEALSSTDGTVNTNGMWKLKKKVFPKHVNPLPVCKKKFQGQIISNPEELKTLYMETYKHRLRQRPISRDLENLKNLKEKLFKQRLRLCKLRKSPAWGAKDLKKVLKNLKTNKARDPKGLINDLFKPGVIGDDLEKSLIMLHNRIKYLI